MGKTYKFANDRELRAIAKRKDVNMSYDRIKNILHNQRRVIYNGNPNSANYGEVIPVNIFKDNVSGIVRKQYDVGRVLKKNIYPQKAEKRTVLNRKQEIELRNKIYPYENVKLIINITYYAIPLSQLEEHDFIDPTMQQVDMLIIESMYDDIVEGEAEFNAADFEPYLYSLDELERTIEIKYDGAADKLNEYLYGNLQENCSLFMYKVRHHIDGYENQEPLMLNGYYGKVLQEVYKATRTWAAVLHIKVETLSKYEGRELHVAKDGTISSSNVYQLEEWANIQYNNEGDEKESCGLKYINNTFPHLYYKFKSIEEKKISEYGQRYANTEDFFYLCDMNSIDYDIYNVSGELEKSSTNVPSIGKLVCIIYQEHIYPVHGGKLRRVRNTDYKIKHVDDDSIFLKKLNNRKIPSRIMIAPISSSKKLESESPAINVISFTSGGIRHINNPEYNICKKFLKKVGMGDMITDAIKLTSLIGIIEKNMKVPSVKSFIPDNGNFVKPPLLWKTDKKIDYDRVVVKDKNKAYACALYSLPYLICFDYRKNSVKKMTNKKKIVDEYLYFVRVNEWSNVIPEDNLYSGYHLKECIAMGVEFELVEELETTTVPNYYRNIIDLTMRHLDDETFKMIWVRHIGCMESGMSSSYQYKFKAVYTNDQKKYYTGYHAKYGDNHGMVFDVKETYKNVRNRFPIASQIKDMSRMIISREIKKMGIKDEDLVQIKTDAIAYYGEKSTDLDKTNFFGWKDEKFSEIDNVSYRNNYSDPLSDIGEVAAGKVRCHSVLELCITDDPSRVRKLHMQYAGAGKTTYILKTLIPNLLNSGYAKEDIIVLTPTHYTLAEYKRAGVNCEIIQKYTFDNTIAQEKYVIIDEIGCIETSCHDMLYKLVHAGKNIECFGDFNQLQPVGEEQKLNKEHYLKYLFKEINTEFKNYRNNFSKHYYNFLISFNDDEHLCEEAWQEILVKNIKKWVIKDWRKAEYILCYRHSTKKRWNKKMLKHLGKKTWKSVGVKIVCTNNKLKDLGIWNKKEFVIKKIKTDGDEKKYVLEDKYKIDKDVIVTDKQLIRNFDMAYACNVHQVQGATLNSYFWAEEDNMFITGNVAYTIISRLKQKLKKKKF